MNPRPSLPGLLPATLLAAALGTGCQESATGFTWEVTATGVEDLCNVPPQAYQESFDYTLFFSGSMTDLRVQGQSFATGEISGCNLSYVSPIMGEKRPSGALVKWQLEGDATLRQGGASCDLPEDRDWVGTEIFTIVESEDPDLVAGCSYTLSLEGTYLGSGE